MDATVLAAAGGSTRTFSLRRFLIAYVKSMRLYYGFVTGVAGWVGVSFYEHVRPGESEPLRQVAILVALFLGYGVNQIYNDYFGLAEDRLNAPNRPMVTGELPPRPALLLSTVLLVGVSVGSYFLSPWSVVPILLGVLLNLLYEVAKAWSLLGNAVFGLSICTCTVYGFLASGPPPEPLLTKYRLAVVLIVALLNGLMTYFTYFKDYAGDLAAGKRTFLVRHGLGAARWAGVIGAFLPTLALLTVHFLGWLPLCEMLRMREFTFCAVMTIFLQFWTAAIYFRLPTGRDAYLGLATNTRACVAGEVTLIAVYNGGLALYLLAASYVLIGFLFDLHKDAKA